MAPFAWPQITYAQSIAVIGPKGSGKTEVLQALLRSKRNALVIDTKLLEDWSDVGMPVAGDDVFRIRAGRYVFAASEQFLIDGGVQSQLFAALLRAKGPRIVAIDEAFDIEDSHGLMMLAKQGRAARVSLWIGTQRPFGIPLYLLSEADHFFVFGLNLKRDRDRVEEATGGAAIPWSTLGAMQYGFVHFKPGGVVSEPTRLDL